MSESNLYIPPCYQEATWRNTTVAMKYRPTGNVEIGFGFDIAGTGEMFRIRLDLDDARHLADSLNESLASYDSPLGEVGRTINN